MLFNLEMLWGESDTSINYARMARSAVPKLFWTRPKSDWWTPRD